jgi:hypothetical protein
VGLAVLEPALGLPWSSKLTLLVLAVWLTPLGSGTFKGGLAVRAGQLAGGGTGDGGAGEENQAVALDHHGHIAMAATAHLPAYRRKPAAASQ